MRHIVPAFACACCLVTAAGCGTIEPARGPRPTSSIARFRDDVRAEFSSAWQKSRRRARQAVEEIHKDLDFHDSEGLDSFGGGATEQVKQMRAEMDATSL